MSLLKRFLNSSLAEYYKKMALLQFYSQIWIDFVLPFLPFLFSLFAAIDISPVSIDTISLIVPGFRFAICIRFFVILQKLSGTTHEKKPRIS